MQVDKESRKNLNSIRLDKKDQVELRGKKLSIGWIRPDVNWKIDYEVDTAETEKEKSRLPHKLVALGVLNSYFKILFFYPVLWRWYYYIKGYTYEELLNVIVLIKKKIQQEAFWTDMVLLVEMMTTWKTMTRKEAEEYQAELKSAGSQLSEKNMGGL